MPALDRHGYFIGNKMTVNELIDELCAILDAPW